MAPAVVLAAVLLTLATGCGDDPGVGSRPSARVPAGSSSSLPAAAPATTSPPAPVGFRSVIVRVQAADGRIVERCVLVADTEALREQGLMGVTDASLAGIGAMLFAYDDEVFRSFWMKDTLVPLSIAFVGGDGTVGATRDMEPCPEGVDCPLYRADRAFRWAVETPRGGLGDWALERGAHLTVTQETGCVP